MNKIPVMKLLVFCPKGGVGTTTIARNIAHELGTEGLGYNVTGLELGPRRASLWNPNINHDEHQAPQLNSEIHRVAQQKHHGITILNDIKQLDLTSAPDSSDDATTQLERMNSIVDQNSQITILDLPSHGNIIDRALQIATHVLIPVTPTDDAVRAALTVISALKNHSASLLGFVPFRIGPDQKSTRRDLEYIQARLAAFGPILPGIQTRQSIAAAASKRLPLNVVRPNCANAKAFRDIAAHIANNVGLS